MCVYFLKAEDNHVKMLSFFDIGANGFSDKQKQSLGRLLARRGVALGQLAR